MESEFPELKSISDDAVYIEATREIKKLQQLENITMQSGNLNDLEKISLFSLAKNRFNKLVPTIGLEVKDKERLEEIMVFLKDKRNKKIYEGYLESLKNQSKTLLISPALGFKD